MLIFDRHCKVRDLGNVDVTLLQELLLPSSLLKHTLSP